MILATLVYSQVASPLPFLFIFTVSTQIYLLTVAFFASTAFDYSLTALLNTILASMMINFDPPSDSHPHWQGSSKACRNSHMHKVTGTVTWPMTGNREH